MTDRIEGLIARLHGLHPRLIDLSLERLLALLDKLDHPEAKLPPVIHVAGTNGKGSTCANLRAIAAAAGWRAHVYTSPHLVRFTERIVIAGQEISEAALAAVLDEVEAINAGARVIEQTVRETLPEGFQRAEFLHRHGIIDMVVERAKLAATLATITALLRPVDAHQPAA